MTTVWGLVDDRTSQSGGVLGVIARLGLPYMLKRLEYNPLAHLPATWLGAGFASLDQRHGARLDPPYPPLVIASGKRALPALRAIKRRAPATRTVYLGWPPVARDLDLIAAPQARMKEAPGIPTLATLAPLHAVSAPTLETARLIWEPQLAHLPRPYIGLLLGGDTGQGRYTAAEWHGLAQRAAILAGGGSLLITTSRRTPPEAAEVIVPLLTAPHLLHRYDADKDNPYLGILACADGLVVTGDSPVMCAEACATGKPVFIYTSERVMLPEQQQLPAALYQRGMARPFDTLAALDWQPTAPLDDAGLVAAEIRRRFPEIFA